MRKTWWRSGDWSAICDVCGLKFKASHLHKRWDGLQVCSKDYEVRHPQELIRAIPDQNKLTWTRPESPNTFVAFCSLVSSQGIAGKSVATCAITRQDNNL